jgi:hypothetical protein
MESSSRLSKLLPSHLLPLIFPHSCLFVPFMPHVLVEHLLCALVLCMSLRAFLLLSPDISLVAFTVRSNNMQAILHHLVVVEGLLGGSGLTPR